MNLAEPTLDETLVRRIRRGELAAFDLLYQRYCRRLFSYILRIVGDRDLAEDLLQEIFITVLKDQSFDLQPGRFAGWIFTVARNRCFSHLRNENLRTEKLRAIEPDCSTSSPALTPEAQTIEAQAIDALRHAISDLPSDQREVLLLKQVAQLSYREISEIEGIPEGTVKSRVHFAIRELQRRVVEQGAS